MSTRPNMINENAAAYFAAQVGGLYRLTEKMGGRRLAARFEYIFNQAATDRRLPCTLKSGAWRGPGNIDPDNYASLLRVAITQASQMAGHKVVGQQIASAAERFDEMAGRNNFELAWRLGLSDFIED